MAVNHTPLDRNKPAGNQYAGHLNTLESALYSVLAHTRTIMEAIDGGEDNANDATKLQTIKVRYLTNGASDDDALAFVDQAQAVRGALNAGLAAFEQAFARLRS